MKPSSFLTLLGIYNRVVTENPAAYFELSRTRYTDWLAFLCSDKKEVNTKREVYASGQSAEDIETACGKLIMALATSHPQFSIDGTQPQFDDESFTNLLGLYRKFLRDHPHCYFELSAHRSRWTAKMGTTHASEHQINLGFGEGFTLHLACINCVIDALAKKMKFQ